ncbi:MAG: hypothetical protein JXL97_18255 [Bacteroidales bacterium]|nr:hypothetical protein [Bacteroidales bacterium]
MKKLITILGLILLLSPAFGQFFDDAQLFGSSRSVNAFNQFDFKEVTESVVQHEFVIKNTDLIDITIISIVIPQGVSVMIPKKVIGPGDEGKIIVSVYKDYVETVEDGNKFDQKFAITVQETLLTGIIINKTYIYQVVGEFH